MKKINALIKICDSILYQECIDAKELGFFIKIKKIIFCGTARIRKTRNQGLHRNVICYVALKVPCPHLNWTEIRFRTDFIGLIPLPLILLADGAI